VVRLQLRVAARGPIIASMPLPTTSQLRIALRPRDQRDRGDRVGEGPMGRSCGWPLPVRDSWSRFATLRAVP